MKDIRRQFSIHFLILFNIIRLRGYSLSILLVTKSPWGQQGELVLEFKWLKIEVRKEIRVNLIKDFGASLSEKGILE